MLFKQLKHHMKIIRIDIEHHPTCSYKHNTAPSFSTIANYTLQIKQIIYGFNFPHTNNFDS